MNDDELPLIEKMRRMYVLTETHDLLSTKLELMEEQDEKRQLVINDLRKIEEELAQYQDNKEAVVSNDVLLNSAFVFPEYED